MVFDLDGTLVDSMPMVLRAYAHALEPFRPGLTAETIRRALGGPPGRFFAEMISDPRQMAEASRRLRDYGAEHWKLMQPFGEMLALLGELRAAAHALAVWTGRERESTLWLMRQHGIDALVHELVCGDDLPSHKPDPAGLEEVLRRLGVARENAVFVGDSEVDVLAGSAIGVRTILITHGVRPDAHIESRAWRVVASVGEASALLRGEFCRPAAGDARG